MEVRSYSDTVPTHTGYYGYNDTTEVVVELTLIFLKLVFIGNLQGKRGGVSTVDPHHYTVKRFKSDD